MEMMYLCSACLREYTRGHIRDAAREYALGTAREHTEDTARWDLKSKS